MTFNFNEEDFPLIEYPKLPEEEVNFEGPDLYVIYPTQIPNEVVVDYPINWRELAISGVISSLILFLGFF